ncbi:ROK family transcriptional regulator [Acidisoma cellulosilytica]|uniref:ROK family transcriptional regulator n=1 Tax=Acidisoma cellulosilyticum TaxID=2802395 RepID=A0A963Z264_9PROT|nr:ROK family transcriptional regulator [Acidisoma cellulosilyticum]MCB8881359.1 ROK family transcriptional regulator [Acidisoma cellulosilyticum]
MFHGTNIEHARTLNRRVVFEAVRRHGAITRADLARLTGLTPQAVSNISAELRDAGLIREGARRQGLRGQPAVELSLEPTGGYAVGLNLGHQFLSGVLVNLAGEVIASDSLPLAAPVLPLDSLMGVMESVVEGLLAQARLPRDQLWGVGCGLPGLVRDGVLIVDTMSGGEDRPHYPLAQSLGTRLNLPVIAENDARAAAIGERLYGIGREARHFFYLHFGFGIGGGMIVDGDHYRGGSGGAGEIGHMIVKPGGRPCSCGNRGCLEQYCSLFSAGEAVGGTERSADQVRPEELSACLAANEPSFMTWLREAAHHLRTAIHNIEVMFDPETVVIGGSLPEDVLNRLVALTQPLLPSVYPDPARGRALPRLTVATAPDMPALGAAALPISAMIQPSLGLLWKVPAGPGAALAQAALSQAQTVLGSPFVRSEVSVTNLTENG